MATHRQLLPSTADDGGASQLQIARCTFDSAYARGRLPVILHMGDSGGGSSSISVAEQVEESHSPPESNQGMRDSAVPSIEAPEHGGHPEHPAGLGLGADTAVLGHALGPRGITDTGTGMARSSQQTPEPPQEDLQGHYIGPASGVSFLLRVQKRLHQAISFSVPSSIFTFGDAPLRPPDFDPSFCMVLPRDAAQRLFDRYFDFAMPTYRFLHRPTLQEWFVEFYDTMGTMREGHGASARIALLFMIFAHARVYMPEDDRPGPSDLSSRYFLAAEHQLSKESGSIRLTSVQARLLQCYYLLTQSRVNHCWSQFGTVTNLALAIGLNRNKVPGAASGLNHIEVESRRRTFWCAYTLDAYLSVSLGRPRSFHDDDIDAELPACVEDHEITRDHAAPSAPNRGYSVMLAPLAHMKLARIISSILRSLYSIKPVSAGRRADETRRISQELADWRAELSRFLDADFFSTSLLVPIFQRQRNVLNLTYWHAIILTHRQCLLNNFAHIAPQHKAASGENTHTKESVIACLSAAMDTMSTINDMTESGQMFQAFWITAYFAFTAAMVLYIYVIQEWASPPETYNAYFIAAARCQSHMSTIAQKGSLLERYCLVLEELRVEALRQMKRLHVSLGFEGLEAMGGYDGMALVDTSPSTGTNNAEWMGEGVLGFGGMDPSGMGDFSGWGQFANMVSSGLGNLDAFHQDDTFRM
ncbi:fungal-specific transcription factor domain-containing protein [Plectosphaerella cucumerina]|uniref:Fungal-specific transcription factor domain-containing protein n=1 Tax=Plectosphaerella cucumerina TaxID=40658 RepID=A0A8K0X081_9PEZI|nr:fungal-specific transcription factor domain-containing protein [Plectosphaerella cucumerina]